MVFHLSLLSMKRKSLMMLVVTLVTLLLMLLVTLTLPSMHLLHIRVFLPQHISSSWFDVCIRVSWAYFPFLPSSWLIWQSWLLWWLVSLFFPLFLVLGAKKRRRLCFLVWEAPLSNYLRNVIYNIYVGHLKSFVMVVEHLWWLWNTWWNIYCNSKLETRFGFNSIMCYVLSCHVF